MRLHVSMLLAALAATLQALAADAPPPAYSVEIVHEGDIRGQSPALRITDTATGARKDVRMPGHDQSVSRMLLRGDRLLIVGRLGDRRGFWGVVDCRAGEILADVWCGEVTLSPDENLVAFETFYSLHFSPVNADVCVAKVWEDNTPIHRLYPGKGIVEPDPRTTDGTSAADDGRTDDYRIDSQIVWRPDSRAFVCAVARMPNAQHRADDNPRSTHELLVVDLRKGVEEARAVVQPLPPGIQADTPVDDRPWFDMGSLLALDESTLHMSYSLEINGPTRELRTKWEDLLDGRPLDPP